VSHVSSLKKDIRFLKVLFKLSFQIKEIRKKIRVAGRVINCC